MSDYIPFNRPHSTGAETVYIEQAIANGHLSGNGPFAQRCSEWLQRETGCVAALLTHSCTGALEMAAMLAGIERGDEVIMPSFTFVSTANAFVSRGGVPVFVDVRADTLNLDEAQVEAAITRRTRAIVPMHYAGIACEMDTILELARRRGLTVVEDAAHALPAAYRDRPLGTLGQLGTLSFHETKNVIAGEGGALLVNDPGLVERAQTIHEKGTDRARFFRGEVDRYTWQDLGSSFAPSEITAAFLWAQLERANEITERRREIWDAYHKAFAPLEREGRLRRPSVPAGHRHNAHMYYVLVADARQRDPLLAHLEQRGVNAVFHYVPLHSSPAGLRYGRAKGELPVTVGASERVVRLPLWIGLGEREIERAVAAVQEALVASVPAGS